MCHNLLSSNLKLFIQRLFRLLIPYIIWPIFIWVSNRLLHLKYNNKYSYSLQMLKEQLLWGSNYMHQFWFQWNLIVITIFFL